ncbi:response regulator [Trichocoleus sp. FACHB-591]|uniref:response regulator transcription factor n=1 Tax=Trichocoleus TaxID=450526 RepID=UPI0016875D9D|nr:MULTISPECIES: response regulator [unclassified Trichocoleus]MBD2094017.1 response regulator [Trichocoleus sp. FACHB-591]MBD2122256.1 response regulator [Trichocoleus sp. FACHB-262]
MSPTQAHPPAKRILIVDDMPDNLSLLEAILIEEGFEVDSARNGKSALALLEASPPALALIDAMMPGMDGYELTRRIRQNKSLPFIPVILITASESASAPAGLDLGANDFIRKPIDYDELMARINAFLRLKDTMSPSQ